MLFIPIALSIIILIPLFLFSAWISKKIDDFLNRYDNKDLDSINKRIEKLRRQYNRLLGQDTRYSFNRMDEIKNEIKILESQAHRLIKEIRSGKTGSVAKF